MDDQRDYEEETYNRAEMEREGREEYEAEAIENRKDIPSVTQWACLCCLLVMANGECCDSDDHGGNGIEPLNEIPEGAHTTLGMFFENHADTCTRKIRPESVTGDYECDCETIPFSHERCDGCGSGLAGERHAFVVWTPAEASPVG